MTKLTAIIDLDGSVVDISTRAASAGPEPERTNRNVYTDWVSVVTRDLAMLPANLNVLNTVRALYRGGAEIIYLTSREESHREASQLWLNRNSAPAGKLLMRGFDDWRSTKDFKGSVLKQIVNARHASSFVAIDDDASNETSDAYLSLGIAHLKVMDNLSSWGRND